MPDMNAYSWNRIGPTLFIEHPVGTGYTYFDPDGSGAHDYLGSEKQVATDLYAFLQTFLRVFKRFQTSDIYFFGESYAGKYVPAAASEILHRNKKLPPDSPLFRLHLKGVGIGNGWMEPFAQTRAYADLLYGNGLIDRQARVQLTQLVEACLTKALSKKVEDRGDFEACNIMQIGMAAAGMPNQYDTRLYDVPVNAYWDELRPDSVMRTFLTDNRTKEALHVSGKVLRSAANATALELALLDYGGDAWEDHEAKDWVVCNDDVNSAMGHDTPSQSVSQLKYILDHSDAVSGEVRALVYSGNRDLNCNTLGTQVCASSERDAGQTGVPPRTMAASPHILCKSAKRLPRSTAIEFAAFGKADCPREDAPSRMLGASLDDTQD
eukprot:scaffold10_cov257-Pinguiococcus_pyrenoidosus.AAC.48